MQAVLERAGEHLAKVMVDTARVLDPELIVLGGPLVPTLGEPFRQAIQTALQVIEEPGAPPPRVELSSNSSDAGVIGAATLVLHDLYAPTARKLSLVSLPPRDPAGQAAA
jgi:predicted NBD/HSP70 family sugar kinase